MGDVESTNLRQGDECAYEAMAKAAQGSVSELLIPFKAAGDAEALLKTMSTQEFFQKFLVHADRFSDQCCQDYAGIMRQTAIVSEVRGRPTLTLAKEIRAEVFEPLDRILASYIQALEQLGINLGSVAAELRNSSVVDAAMKGAAVGQLAGGFGSSGKTLGGINALLQAGAEAEKRLALLQREAEVLDQAEFITYRKIAEYLEAVIGLPGRLLDYGCARSFGGQVLLERQRKALEEVQATIVQELEPAVRLTLALPDAAKRLKQQSLDAAEKVSAAKEANWENDPTSPKLWIKFFTGFGLVVLIIIVIGIVISLFLPKE